jgi:hypothetical protein
MKNSFCTLDVASKPKDKYTAIINPTSYCADVIAAADILLVPEVNSQLRGRSFNVCGDGVWECCVYVLSVLSPYPLSEIIINDTGIGLFFFLIV